MAVDLEERPQNPQPEQHDDSITHAFILEYMQRGFAEVHARLDALNARIDRLLIVLIAGMFGIAASIIGVAIASFLNSGN